MGEFQRWNTHHSHVVPIEVCGHQLNIAQDPTSDNLGTTIWDASVILVRYMERNPQLYSRRKLAGKRVLELGAGCGLAGMYFALQGAHVTFTDLAEVVPLLQRNLTMNLGGQARVATTETGADKGGKASRLQFDVLEYCWGMPLDGLSPPYDFVVACDCVYVERLVESLVSSMTRVSGRGTTVLVASEKREEVTYAKFRERLAEDFTVRQAPRRHMDKGYDHENSEVLLCKLRRGNAHSSKSAEKGSGKGETGEIGVGNERTEGGGGELSVVGGEKRDGDVVGAVCDAQDSMSNHTSTRLTSQEGIEIALGLGLEEAGAARGMDETVTIQQTLSESHSLEHDATTEQEEEGERVGGQDRDGESSSLVSLPVSTRSVPQQKVGVLVDAAVSLSLNDPRSASVESGIVGDPHAMTIAAADADAER